MSENADNNPIQQITLDGQPTTLSELNEAKKQKGVKIKETAPGEYKTLQRLNG